MNKNRVSKKRDANLINLKGPWRRADKIAMGVLIITILGTLTNIAITSVAANVAFKAEQRAHQSDVRGAEAIVAAVGDKVRLLAQSAEYSAMFLEAFVGRLEQHPEDAGRVEQLTVDFLQKLTLPEVVSSTEQLSLLARSDSDAARKLAACTSRRVEVESDIKSVAAANAHQLKMEQENTLNVLPYRLHMLSDACNRAIESLAALAPALLSKSEPLRGTLGEIEAAQEVKERRKNSGLNATLEISNGQNNHTP